MASVWKMQCLLIALLIFIMADLVSSRKLYLHDQSSSMHERHQLWMKKYGRVYRDKAEKERRFEIFKHNVKFIESFNAAGNKSYKLRINKFADLSNDEFKASHNGYRRSEQTRSVKATSFKYANVTGLPASMDWRKQGAVTPVKDQDDCGSCWSFSALAAVESSYLLKYGDPYDLSEQQLVECDYTDHNRACNMGYMTEAYDYIIANGGVTTEQNYPYVAGRQYCDRIKAAQPVAQLAYYQLVPPNSEAALIQAVNMAPVSVGLSGDETFFHHYTGGIITAQHCNPTFNHAALLIEHWGEGGYMRIARDGKAGICGITSAATIPFIR
ncbi:hypothetical protein P3X46_019126 [Hevea brasiliensis]|uniref:Cysteine proteinase n=1 Tax=Hevea brasiliensis TaxID=3981 RepID=A0ABQ9LU25_HEVBR|nr:hypothetical protein P3X46_019126 [Hevea brasiliensis]